jgi:hypothetical protein
MVYDPLYMPFKDKPVANPRHEALYNVLGRVNIKLLTGNFDSGNITEKDETSVEENSDTFSDLSPFNPFRSDTVAGRSGMRLHPVPSTVRRTKSTEDSVDEQILGELTKGMQEVDKEGMDVPDHEASSSSEALATTGQHRYTHSKSGGISSKKAPTTTFSEANCELENYRCSSESTCC